MEWHIKNPIVEKIKRNTSNHRLIIEPCDVAINARVLATMRTYTLVNHNLSFATCLA